jgi:hypothetical protein
MPSRSAISNSVASGSTVMVLKLISSEAGMALRGPPR